MNGAQEIINYFVNRESSGFVEGLNNKLKVLKRRCYGLFNLKHFSNVSSSIWKAIACSQADHHMWPNHGNSQ